MRNFDSVKWNSIIKNLTFQNLRPKFWSINRVSHKYYLYKFLSFLADQVMIRTRSLYHFEDEIFTSRPSFWCKIFSQSEVWNLIKFDPELPHLTLTDRDEIWHRQSFLISYKNIYISCPVLVTQINKTNKNICWLEIKLDTMIVFTMPNYVNIDGFMTHAAWVMLLWVIENLFFGRWFGLKWPLLTLRS